MLKEIFPWDDTFITGIDIIDEQHQKLVEMVNSLANHLVYRHRDNNFAVQQVIKELIEYTHYHFETEESIWNQHLQNDPMALEHQAVHNSFVDKVLTLQSALPDESEEIISEEVLSFLIHWLAYHIIDSDKHLAKVTLALQSGLTFEEAKEQATEEMGGSMRMLITTVLKMYDSLSTQALQLMREINERQRAEANYRLNKKAVDATLESIFITDADGVIIDANPAFCRDSSLSYQEIRGKNLRAIKPSIFSDQHKIWESALNDGHWMGIVNVKSKLSDDPDYWLALSSIRDEEGSVSHFAGVISSVSQLIERQNMLETAANHDVLTHLPGRRILDDRLKLLIAQAKRQNQLLVACFMDLDGFKPINDNYGHDAGDEVLIEVARRLKHCSREVDTVIRYGGDEFVILAGGIDSMDKVAIYMNRILKTVSSPISLSHGSEVQVHMSIGVATYPHSPADKLIRHADEAMYIAKKQGKSQWVHFKG